MAARTIDGPDRDWMDMNAVSAFVGLSERTIRRLMAEGEFPRPMNATNTAGGTRLWNWQQVLYWTLRVTQRPYLRVSKKKSGEKTRDKPRP